MGIDNIFKDIFQGPSGFQWDSVGILDLIRILLDIVRLLLLLGNVTAVVLIIWNAFGLVNAYSNEEGVKNAKKGIYAAVTGIIIITLSYFIITFLYKWLTGQEAPNDINSAIPT